MSALVIVGVAWLGWALAVGAGLALRRRRIAIADAEHELRGAATAIGLAAQRLDQGGAASEFAPVVRLELARMGAALAELSGVGGGATPAGALDVDRLAAVLGNVIDNVAEHGVGPVGVRSWRECGLLRLEIANRAAGGGPRTGGRGRGLAIAERAARALGGRVRVESEDGVTRAVVELPAEPGAPCDAAPGDAPDDDLPRAA